MASLSVITVVIAIISTCIPLQSVASSVKVRSGKPFQRTLVAKEDYVQYSAILLVSPKIGDGLPSGTFHIGSVEEALR